MTVCFVAGCGKTLIAANIIENLLKKRRTLNLPTEPKVVFFAPGVALVNQQFERLQNYLPDDVE